MRRRSMPLVQLDTQPPHSSRHRPAGAVLLAVCLAVLALAAAGGIAYVWQAPAPVVIGPYAVVGPAAGSSAGPVTGVAFSPNGRYLVTTSRAGAARVWDARTGRPAAILFTRAGSGPGSINYRVRTLYLNGVIVPFRAQARIGPFVLYRLQR